MERCEWTKSFRSGNIITSFNRLTRWALYSERETEPSKKNYIFHVVASIGELFLWKESSSSFVFNYTIGSLSIFDFSGIKLRHYTASENESFLCSARLVENFNSISSFVRSLFCCIVTPLSSPSSSFDEYRNHNTPARVYWNWKINHLKTLSASPCRCRWVGVGGPLIRITFFGRFRSFLESSKSHQITWEDMAPYRSDEEVDVKWIEGVNAALTHS